MESPPRRLAASVVAALLAVLVAEGPASAQAPPPPTLALDTRFAPPDGIARDDLSGTATDIPSAVAVDGERIYTVGETRDSAGDSDIGIVALRADGQYDTGFAEFGTLVLPIAEGAGKDVATDVAVLPDHRLRILASTPGTNTGIDVAIVGLNRDGTPDSGFGTNGKVVFPAAAGAGNDTPTRMAIGPGGQIAVTGAASDGSKEDLFVALRGADGSPVAGFGNAHGVRVFDRAGTGLNDRGADVAFRPGGGIVALVQVETNLDSAINDYRAVLHAFDATAGHDGRFAPGGDLVLPVGSPDTVPGSLMSYGGRLWVSGATHVGADTDAFIARLNADGSGFESRLYDVRGGAIAPEQSVTSSGSDLDVVPGTPPTLIVTGSINFNQRPYWAAAAFNNLDAPLASAGYGDLLIPTDEYGAIVGLAPGPDGWAAIAGSLVDLSNNFDTSFGTARLLIDRGLVDGGLVIDAPTRCDLALEVVEPLELALPPAGTAPITLRVSNAGARACAGTLSASAPYGLEGAPLAIGAVGPGGSVTTSGMRLSHAGSSRRDGVVELRITAPDDANPANDARRLGVLFNYCDLALRPVGRAPAAPVEGSRRYELSARNAGTRPCERVRIGVAGGGRIAGNQDAFTLLPKRSASVDVRARVARGLRPGGTARLTFRALATRDAMPGNETVTLKPRLVAVGDSNIRGVSARTIRGAARGGTGAGGRRLLRLRGVDVAVQRLGKGCQVLGGRSGALRKLPRSGGKCTRKVWSRARGSRSWRLTLRRALPPGRYVAFSRALTGPGFREAAFSRRDRNRVTFEVG
jgi:uncharacterized delta-60 repeat protein